jgi:hypothetical protein
VVFSGALLASQDFLAGRPQYDLFKIYRLQSDLRTINRALSRCYVPKKASATRRGVEQEPNGALKVEK